MAGMEVRFPMRQEQFEVGRGDVADGPDPEPVDEVRSEYEYWSRVEAARPRRRRLLSKLWRSCSRSRRSP